MTPLLGLKFDEGKPRLTKLPWIALEHVAKVLKFGATPLADGGRGYTWDNWQHVVAEPWDGEPNGRNRYLDAAMRHIRKSSGGQIVDPDSHVWRLHHLGCAAACVLFVLWFDLTKESVDGKGPAAGDGGTGRQSGPPPGDAG